MDALNYERNRDGKEEINHARCEDTILFTITIARGCTWARCNG